MRWLRKLLGASLKEDLEGIRMDTRRPIWELDGRTDFPHLLDALADFLPEGSMLYFEGGSPNKELRQFFNAQAVPEQTHVAVGILWPKPVYYHVPATPQNLSQLAELSARCAEPELAVHFHAYHNGEVLLEWHDAFMQAMLLSGDLPEDMVRRFATALSMKVTRCKNSDQNGN